MGQLGTYLGVPDITLNELINALKLCLPAPVVFGSKEFLVMYSLWFG